MPKLSNTLAERKKVVAGCDQALQLVRASGSFRLWKSKFHLRDGFYTTNGAQPMLARIQSLDSAIACFKSITNGIAHD